MVSGLAGVSAWDSSRMLLVGDELSPLQLTGVMSGVVGASGLSLVFLRW